MKEEIKNVAADFLLTAYGKTERGNYAKACLQDATKFPAASLSEQVCDIDSAKWDSARLVIDECHPIYDFQIVKTIEGRIFKKKVRTLVLIGTDSTTDLSECATVADLAAYLSANKLDIKSLAASVANIGIGTVGREDGVVSKEVNLNYNVASAEFDHDKMALSFAAEDRLFT